MSQQPAILWRLNSISIHGKSEIKGSPTLGHWQKKINCEPANQRHLAFHPGIKFRERGIFRDCLYLPPMPGRAPPPRDL